MSLRRYIDIVENVITHLKKLERWGESIGIYADMWETDEGIYLGQITREGSEKGRGGEFLRELCRYADHRKLPVTLDVMGGNDQLENYYARFGFEVIEHERDDECGDVQMIRFPKRDIEMWETRR